MNYNFQGKLDCERGGIKNEFQLFLTQIGPIFWSKKGTNMELLKKYFYFQLIKKTAPSQKIVHFPHLGITQ